MYVVGCCCYPSPPMIFHTPALRLAWIISNMQWGAVATSPPMIFYTPALPVAWIILDMQWGAVATPPMIFYTPALLLAWKISNMQWGAVATPPHPHDFLYPWPSPWCNPIME